MLRLPPPTIEIYSNVVNIELTALDLVDINKLKVFLDIEPVIQPSAQ